MENTQTPVRTKYIYRDEKNNRDYLVEIAEGYCNRRKLSQKSSNIKKLQRMNRVRQRGFRKQLATQSEVKTYGPAINVG